MPDREASRHEHYFVDEGGLFWATPIARSPWDRGTIAGGPTSSLLASHAEDEALDKEFDIARFQIDILGKVPDLPLRVTRVAVRDGRQTKLHRLELSTHGKTVAQAHVLRVRRAATPVILPSETYSLPEGLSDLDKHSVPWMPSPQKVRRVHGTRGKPGRGIAWFAIDGHVIAGRAPSNFVKACLIADFGNGFGNATPAYEWSYANLDITIQFLRMPVGEWLLLDAETHMAGNGHGTVRSVFADKQGIYARGFQTIFVAPGHLSKSLPGQSQVPA